MSETTNRFRFVFVQNNLPQDRNASLATPTALYALYDIEDTSQAQDKRVLASGVRFEAARMIVAALNRAT